MEMVERRKNYSLYIKNDIEFGIFCEILKEVEIYNEALLRFFHQTKYALLLL